MKSISEKRALLSVYGKGKSVDDVYQDSNSQSFLYHVDETAVQFIFLSATTATTTKIRGQILTWKGEANVTISVK